MDDVAAPPTYVARANALEYEAIWRLGPDALELQGGRPPARFRSGKNPAAYWAEHIFLLAMVVLLVVVLAAVGFGPLSDSSWSKLWIVLGSIPLLLVYTRKNWPGGFKPDAIPKDVRPA